MSYDQWQACYMVFRTAMIMLEYATPSALDSYRDHIRSYATRFGNQCWALIYQTDTRARRELTERIRRRGQGSQTTLDSLGVRAIGFDPERPWEFVFRQLPLEFSFWKKELEDPALLVLARAPGSAVTSEAPIARHRGQHITQVAGDAPLANLSADPRPAKLPKLATPPQRTHNVDAAGMFLTNRRGATLCAAFQTNSCTSPSCHSVHQCSICPQPTHGASDCPNKDRQQKNREGQQDKGKGKKGGKGKGKGKKRTQW